MALQQEEDWPVKQLIIERKFKKMSDLNRWVGSGRLTRTPELRYTKSGTPVMDLSLAVNRKYKQNDEWKEEVAFVDCTVWGARAEGLSKILDKGKYISVEGRLRFEAWDDKAGVKRSKLSVVLDEVCLPPMGDKSNKSQTANVGAGGPDGDDSPF